MANRKAKKTKVGTTEAMAEPVPVAMGDTVYLVCTFPDGSPDAADVFETTYVRDEEKDHCEVLIDFGQGSGPQPLSVPRRNVFHTRDTAEKRLLARNLNRHRNELRAALGGNVDFYPEPNRRIKEGVLFTGNPLRAGEPSVAFVTRSNTWGKDDNPQKTLQTAGVIWEDIRVLFGILHILGFANDYSKKLIGKYIIIEMRSLYDCLERLCKMDVRYKPYFIQLQRNLSRLDKSFPYTTIRNNIGAHRDGNLDVLDATDQWRKITRYNLLRHLAAFSRHIRDVATIYPDEITECFRPPQVHKGLRGAREEENETYEPFDPPWLNVESAK